MTPIQTLRELIVYLEVRGVNDFTLNFQKGKIDLLLVSPLGYHAKALGHDSIDDALRDLEARNVLEGFAE